MADFIILVACVVAVSICYSLMRSRLVIKSYRVYCDAEPINLYHSRVGPLNVPEIGVKFPSVLLKTLEWKPVLGHDKLFDDLYGVKQMEIIATFEAHPSDITIVMP